MKPRLHDGHLMFNRFGLSYTIGGFNNYLPNGGTVIDSGAGVGPVMTANLIYATPIWMPRDFRLKQYGYVVNNLAATGPNLAFGIYTDSTDMAMGYRTPHRKVDQGNATNLQTTGFYSRTLGTPIMLRGGSLYWGVICWDGTGALNVRGGESALFHITGIFVDTVPSFPLAPRRGLQTGWTYAATLPDPITTQGQEERFAYTVFMREPNQNGS